MKIIIKQGEPKELIDYKLRNKQIPENLDYRNLGSVERTPIKEALLTEQGFICAYTLKRISKDTCHIEHIKPEGLCRQHTKEGYDSCTDLDYLNMVACFPKDGMPNHNRYGAQFKDDWWENDGKDFISPFVINCEDQFSFNSKGEIIGLTNSAKKTIEILKLDHDSLIEDRKRAIQAFIFDDNQKPISKAKAQAAVSEITQLRSGRYAQYCLPIKFGLNEYIQKIDKLAQKNKFIKSSKNKK
jgi:uncharacterized protein (TIGR02646 family)